MKKALLLLAIIFVTLQGVSQNYTTYALGNSNDVVTTAQGGVCLMGGASENDNAMRWFLQKANGGDVLVLRASGSDGYNSYFYNDLGVSINSVETIVFHNAAASSAAYVHQKINQAEAIWFAGGDQWDYVSYWRNTAVDSLIRQALQTRNIVIGGTSAGMAILGEYYFTAAAGTVTSAQALSNPYNTYMTVDSARFLGNIWLQNVITDTHYDSRERKGRHVAFMARMVTDFGVAARGIACDEYTAVCIDNNGIAKVFGNYPADDDNAYFIQTNCLLSDVTPENCTAGQPLNWNLGNSALKVYSVKGRQNGVNYLDLNDWTTGSGGTWENWWVANGTFQSAVTTPLNCVSATNPIFATTDIIDFTPNPVQNFLFLKIKKTIEFLTITDMSGKVWKQLENVEIATIQIDTTALPSGKYVLSARYQGQNYSTVFIVN